MPHDESQSHQGNNPTQSIFYNRDAQRERPSLKKEIAPGDKINKIDENEESEVIYNVRKGKNKDVM